MGLFGGSGGNAARDYQRQNSGLGSIFPDAREKASREELREAEAAYGAAEDRLIKARRAYEDASREWEKFYYPKQGSQ